MTTVDTSVNTNGVNGVSNTTSTNSTTTTQTVNLYNTIADIDGDTINFTNTIKNATSQKDKINSAISGEGLKAKRDEVSSTLEALKKELENIEQKIATAKENLEKAQADYDKAVAEIERLTSLKEQEQANLKKLEQDYNDQNKKHGEIAKDIEKLDDSMNGISKKISNYTSELESETKSAQEQAIWEALYSYDETKDGPYEEYVASKLGELAPDGRLSGIISDLSGQSSQLVKQMAGLQLDLKKYNDLMSATETKITQSRNLIKDYTVQIADNETLKATSEAAITTHTQEISNFERIQKENPPKVELLEKQLSDYDYLISNNFSPISDEEWKFVEDNNIDLSERLPDGNPRYIIAPGDKDKRYHIYDMAQDGYAIVRKTAEGGGYDIIENGNGHINNLTTKSAGDGKIAFSLDDCDNLSYQNVCYHTTSPLAFDLEGDGIKTTGAIINFDIDGDGKIDKINDAADAILVFDADGDGISGENGLEVFGDNTDLDGDGKKDGYKDGFEALKALAKKEGLIGENDSKLDENDLKVLEEKYGFGMKTGGYNSETKSLSEIGITEINLANTDETTLIDNFDGQGNQLMTQEGATFVINGKEHEYADIWHRKYNEDSSSSNSSVGGNFFTLSDAAKLPSDLYDLKFTNHDKVTSEFSEMAENAIGSLKRTNLFSSSKIDELTADGKSAAAKMKTHVPDSNSSDASEEVENQNAETVDEANDEDVMMKKQELEEEI